MAEITFITRHLTDDDKAYIYNSWLKNNHNQYPNTLIPKTLYFGPQSAVIERCLDRAETLIAVFPEDASEILAYICYEHNSEAMILHYLMVKPLYRKKGIAAELISTAIQDKKLVIATHIFNGVKKLRRKLPGVRVVYDPFSLPR